MLWARLVSRESMSTSALGAIRTMRQRECFLVLWVRLVSKRVFPYALGTFSVKKRECVSTSALVRFIRCGRERESISLYFGYDLASKRECFLVLWARLVSKEREFTGALGRDSYDFGYEKWSVYWCFERRIRLETQWFEVGAYTRQSIRWVFDYYITLWVVLALVLECAQGSSTCGWGKYVVGILPLLVTWFCHVTSGHPYSPQSAYITPLSFLVLRNQSTFTL